MLLQLLIVPLALAAAGFILAAREYRIALADAAGTYEIVCPRDSHRATVTFDTKKAARTAAFGLPHHLRLTSCTFWPEREGCDQHCIKQIAPGHTHVLHA
jgi:hypothetical protein